MRGLLLGADQEVARWAFAAHRLRPTLVDHAVGILGDDGKLCGAVLLQALNGADVHLSYYGRNTLSTGIVRAVARIILALGVARVTAVTSKQNRHVVRFLQRIGFGLEGTMRRYYGQRDCKKNTGVRLVMFRERVEQIARMGAAPLDAVRTTPQLQPARN